MRLNFRLLTLTFVAMIITCGYFGGWWDRIRVEMFSTDTEKTTPARPDPPAIVITRPKLIGWRDMKKDWEIEALKIWQTNNGNQFHFEKIINGVVYSVKDKRVEFSADWARLDRSRSEIYLGGGLFARIDKGNISTEQGFMKYKEEELFCPNPVTYQEEDMLVKANKMSVHFKKDEILLEGDVQLIEKKDRMMADGLLFNTKEKKYYLIAPKGITIYP